MEEQDNSVVILNDSVVRVLKQTKTANSTTEIEQGGGGGGDSFRCIHEHFHSEVS